MEVKGNLIIHGSFIDIHDNDRVDLRVDRAEVQINGKDIREIREMAESNASDDAPASVVPDSVKDCFRYANAYVGEQVKDIVTEFYLNKPARLAMIEVTLFDHGQLLARNGHKAFVQALLDWKILPEDTDVSKVSNAMASKLKSPFPTKGYKDWDKNYLNDQTLCKEIGKKLPESMRYNR